MTPSAADEILLRRTLDFERRQEKFAALLVQHDEELAKLAEVLPAWKDSFLSRLPEITDKFERVIPALIAEEIGKAKVGISAEQARAAGEAAFALGKARDELFAMVRELDAKLGGEMAKVKTPAEISAELEQIADRVSLENARRLFAEKGAELEANWKAQLEARKPERIEFATPPLLADAFRGNWKQGVTSAARGDVWQWFGSTFVALENTSETPNKSQAMRGNGAWGLLASSGAGGGGGGGGDSLPSQTGNAGKFLKTDGTSTLWEAIPGGGDMLGANNLTDVASVTIAFANIKQAATTTASGVVTFATSGESAALKAVQANDARLSDSRTPTAHASTHQTGGSDPIDFPVDSVFGATNTITQVDYVAVNTSSTVAVTTAKAVWNATESTLELGFNSSTSTMLGMDLHAQIYNQSGGAFSKGQVVKADGSSGTRLKGSLALATSDANSAQTLGVCSQAISNNSSGVIITQGVLRAIDTNAFNEGDTLWLSATTAGAMTNVRPTAPNHGVRIGYVVKKAGVADGIIFVDVLNGVELDELHDVAITAVANNDFLSYNASTTVWRNRQLFDSTAPAALAVSATAGVSVTAARVDHVHARPTFDELTISGAAQGDILYRGSTSWARLPAATAGFVLQTNGAAANPSWAASGGVSDGDKGDISVTASGATWTIDNAVVSPAKMTTAAKTNVVGIVIDGGGSAITTGVKGYIKVPFACTIGSAQLLADVSGSIVVDVWKDTLANYPPTVADTICASAKPTLSSQTNSNNTTLTGWTTTINADDVLGFNVDSATTVTRVTLELIVTRN